MIATTRRTALLVGFATLACAQACGPATPGARARPAASSAPTTAPGPSVPRAPELPVVAFGDSDGGKSSLCTAKVGRAGLEGRACVPLPAPPLQIVWADADALFVLLETEAVVRVEVEAGRATALELPPKSEWKGEPPPGPARGDIVEDDDEPRLEFTARGNLWLTRCSWRAKYDLPACVATESRRIHPKPVVSGDPARDEDAVRPSSKPSDSTEPAAPKPRFEVRVVRPDHGDDRVECSIGGVTSTIPVVGPSNASTRASVDAPWPSSDHYLLEVVHDYIEVESIEVFLMKACSPTPLSSVATGNNETDGIVHGPDELWVHSGKEGWLLRRAEVKLAVLPGVTAQPEFR